MDDVYIKDLINSDNYSEEYSKKMLYMVYLENK